MENKSIAKLNKIGYILILVVASIPLFCGYIMEGGEVLQWIGRIEEVKEGMLSGHLHFFPTLELIQQAGVRYSALDSNLWLLFPAFLRVLGLSITDAWCIYMFILNIGTIIGAYLFFKQWLENSYSTIFAVLFYMTSPYRVYICYDKADLGAVIAWVFIFYFLYGMLCIWQKKENMKILIMTIVSFAAIGYADTILLAVIILICVLGTIWHFNWKAVLPFVLGSLLYLPGAMRWLNYLFSDSMADWGLPFGIISEQGYAVGQFCTFWVYSAERPGLGMGLILGLMVLVWLCVTERDWNILYKQGFFVCSFILMCVMSLEMFPWELMQRTGMFFMKLISLFETPGVCFGFATIFASGLSALGIKYLMKKEEKNLKIISLLFIAFATLGVCIYMCGTLTYSRLPLLVM